MSPRWPSAIDPTTAQTDDGAAEAGYHRSVAARRATLDSFRAVLRPAFADYRQCRGEIMIGPPGLPKFGRRVFSFAGTETARPRHERQGWKWLAGLYLAGVLAHFSHHMVAVAPAPGDPAYLEALASAPWSLAWPADLIGTLIPRS